MNTTVIVSFQTKPDQIDALSEFLSGVQVPVLEAGGMSISLMQDQDDPTRFFEIEVWATADAHKQFVEGAAAAGAFEPLDTILAAPFSVNYLSTVKHSEA